MMDQAPALLDTQQRDLEEIFTSRRFRTSFPDRLAYQNDCWPRGILLSRGRRLDHHLASGIVWPENLEELKELIRWARQQKIALVPFGAGSGVCGGAVPDMGSIVVDLKRMNRLLKVDEVNSLVVAQPGILGIDLERRLNQQGWTLGHYPSSLYCSSLGGYLAARSAGQYSSRYGKIEDMILSMEVITGTGETLYTTAYPGKEVPLGPRRADLTPLFVGSEGTLGFITEGLLRIERLPPTQIYRGYEFATLPDALLAIRKMMQAGLRPAVVRLYDEFDSLISSSKKRATTAPSQQEESLKSSPRLFSRLQSQAKELLPEKLIHQVTSSLLGRAVGNPLLLNRVAAAIPGSCLLVLGFEGEETLTQVESEYAFSICDRFGKSLGPGPGQHWLENRFSVSYKQSPMLHLGAFVDTMEVSTTWSNLMPLYKAVHRALRPHVFVMAHFSHVYAEGSSIYFTFAGFGKDGDETLSRYEATWEAGLTAVAESGASIAHHHGVGQSKARWTERDHPQGRAHFEALKDRYDPDRILNPGKVYL